MKTEQEIKKRIEAFRRELGHWQEKYQDHSLTSSTVALIALDIKRKIEALEWVLETDNE